jgi:hypothetical protein
MFDLSTGPDDSEPEKKIGEPCTDFDWVTGALCYALVEEITLEDLELVVTLAKTGEEFDAGVSATIWLKDIVKGDTLESF